jgi:hypothetical protein
MGNAAKPAGFTPMPDTPAAPPAAGPA